MERKRRTSGRYISNRREDQLGVFLCRIKIVIAGLLLLSIGTVFSQNIDSIKTLLKTSAEDTITLNRLVILSAIIPDANEWPIYNEKAAKLAEKLMLSQDPAIKLRAKKVLYMMLNDQGLIFSDQGNTAKALERYEKSLKMMEEVGDKKGIANTLNNIGFMYYHTGEILNSLDYFGRSLRIQETLGDKKGLALSLNNIGVIYKSYGNIPKAIEFFQKGLKIREDINDQAGIANSMNAIGSIYHSQRDYIKAFEYLNKALAIQEIIGDQNHVVETSLNIGTVYWEQQKSEKAFEYYEKGLKLAEKINYMNGISLAYDHFGNFYLKKGQTDKALEFYQKGMAISEKSNFKRGIVASSISIGTAYFIKKNFKLASVFMERALKLGRELGSTEKIAGSERILSKIDSANGNFKGAFDHYKQYLLFNDSLNNETTRKASVKSQFQIEFDRKEREVNLRADAEKKLIKQRNEDERKQKNIVIYSVIFGLIVVLVFSGFLFKSLRENKKANFIITRQKQEVEESKKEIVDSINYAKRIQYALLASDNLLKNNLPDHFILFQPKDVVSGDFYWGTPTNDGFIYITADCTGHGVPGAFMSLLNISKLSQAINENKITRPDLILNNVRYEITKALNSEGTEEESKDGMDAVLCKLNLNEMKLQYAAANNSFFIIRANQIITCKADKMPVGKGHDDSVLFTFNEVALEKGDTIYTFTDGYADQFGGLKGKKFKYKQLESLLLGIHKEPMEKQKEILLNRFSEWKGNLEQIDDMLIIGVRI